MQKCTSDQDNSRWLEPYAVLELPMSLTTNFHRDILKSGIENVLIKTSAADG